MPKLIFTCTALFTLKNGAFKKTKNIYIEAYSISGAIIDFTKQIKPFIVKNKLTNTTIEIRGLQGEYFKQKIN